VNTNLDIMDKIANAIPNTFCVYLKNIDADFVPHYMVHKLGLAINQKSLHIISSNDKDMAQTIRLPNVKIYIRKKCLKDVLNENSEVILKKGSTQHLTVSSEDANLYYFKTNAPITANLSSIYLSILGDDSDSIMGIRGIGPITANKIFEYLSSNSILKDEVYTAKEFVNLLRTVTCAPSVVQKNINKIIENEDIFTLAWKQVDFDELIKHLDIMHIERIEKVVNKQYIKEINNIDDLNKVLMRSIGINFNNM